MAGTVSDTRQYGLTQEACSRFYVPYGQLSFSMMTLVVRTEGNPASVTPALREAVRELDPALPVGQVRTPEDMQARSASSQRFSAILLRTFATSALPRAAVGRCGSVLILRRAGVNGCRPFGPPIIMRNHYCRSVRSNTLTTGCGLELCTLRSTEEVNMIVDRRLLMRSDGILLLRGAMDGRNNVQPVPGAPPWIVIVRTSRLAERLSRDSDQAAVACPDSRRAQFARTGI